MFLYVCVCVLVCVYVCVYVSHSLVCRLVASPGSPSGNSVLFILILASLFPFYFFFFS